MSDLKNKIIKDIQNLQVFQEVKEDSTNYVIDDETLYDEPGKARRDSFVSDFTVDRNDKM